MRPRYASRRARHGPAPGGREWQGEASTAVTETPPARAPRSRVSRDVRRRVQQPVAGRHNRAQDPAGQRRPAQALPPLSRTANQR
jgi:hypothetical protein